MAEQQATTETDATEREPHALPRAYVNSMTLAISLSDVSITTYVDNTPQQRLHMSMTTAKTLAEQLKLMIDEFEQAVGSTVPTMDDTRRVLDEMQQTEEEEHAE